MSWNVRYVAYARANGRKPEAQLKHDREAWPGGVMCGFILWISAKWAEYRAARKLGPYAIVSEEMHEEFNAGLL